MSKTLAFTANEFAQVKEIHPACQKFRFYIENNMRRFGVEDT